MSHFVSRARLGRDAFAEAKRLARARLARHRHSAPSLGTHFGQRSAWHTECNERVKDGRMAKSTSLAELHPRPRASGESKARKRVPGALARRAEAVVSELSALPMKPLLIGVGIGAALLGSALAVSSRRTSVGSPFRGMNQTLTKTALVALARVVSGQTVRSVTTSALLDVADAMKKTER